MSSDRLRVGGPGEGWWRPALAADLPEASPASAGTAQEPSGGAGAFWASIGFTFILFTAPQQFFPMLASMRIALVMAGLAVLACLVDRFTRRQPLTVVTREMWLTGGLVGWAILMVPLSYWPGGSVGFLLDLYFKSLAIFWLLSNTVNTQARFRQLALVLSLIAIPLAGTAVANFFSANFLPGFVQAPKRIVGYDAPLTGNPNDLALTLNLIMPLSIAVLFTVRHQALRILLIAVIVLDVLAVIVTFSRGGFLTLATVIGVYVWKLRGRPERVWAWAAIVLVLVSLPLIPSGYLGRLATITDIDSDVTGSAQLRWDDTISALTFVLANPIVGAGVGMNTLALHSKTDWRAIHNVYLEYAVELGLPGLTLFLLLLVGCIRSVVAVQRGAVRTSAFRDLFYVAEGIQISLLAFSVAALFHPVGYHLYFYYIAGLAVAIKVLWAAQESSAVRVRGSPRRDCSGATTWRGRP